MTFRFEERANPMYCTLHVSERLVDYSDTTKTTERTEKLWSRIRAVRGVNTVLFIHPYEVTVGHSRAIDPVVVLRDVLAEIVAFLKEVDNTDCYPLEELPTILPEPAYSEA